MCCGERFEDATPLALKMEAGSHAKECGQPLKAGKGPETGSPRDPQEGAQPCRHPGISPATPILDF